MRGLTGGCLCGAIRFKTDVPPDWITICFCRFCQKATGSTQMVEPIFPSAAFRVTTGTPQVYTHVSDGSGQAVYVHFCPTCASKLYLTFARWEDRLGVYSGALDDPDALEITPETTKYIFTESAPCGAMVPAGFNSYPQHASTNGGTPEIPEIHEAHWRRA